MTIDGATLRQSILSDGVDDYFGLYEIVWSLNVKYPDLTETEKLAAAIPVAAEMLDQGLIELYESAWSPRAFKLLPLAEAAAAVSDPSSWRPPDEREGCYVSFAATEAGERVYYGSKWRE